MNTRTHEIIREYIGVLTHQALNRELTWTTAVGDMEYRYIIKEILPDGRRRSLYSSPPTETVCPALLPP